MIVEFPGEFLKGFFARPNFAEPYSSKWQSEEKEEKKEKTLKKPLDI